MMTSHNIFRVSSTQNFIPKLAQSYTNIFYISGVLETSYEDFESGEDVYEAIGGVLHEVASDKTEDDIKWEFFSHNFFTNFFSIF